MNYPYDSSFSRPIRCPKCRQSRYALENRGFVPNGKHKYKCSLCGKYFNYPLEGRQDKRIHYKLNPRIYKGSFDPLEFFSQVESRMEADEE